MNWILPQLEPDYDRSIDKLIADHDTNANKMNFTEWEWSCAEIEKRTLIRDTILDLQDQLNDAGLVIVRQSDVDIAHIAGEHVGDCIAKFIIEGQPANVGLIRDEGDGA